MAEDWGSLSPWLETASETFVARHDERDAPDVERVLAQLEHTRSRLDRRFPERLGELAVVVHGSTAQLDAAEPWVPLQRRLTAPAGRRYLVGWAAERELHVLAPRLLAQRASNVEGSLELLMLAPAALLARRYVAANHPGMPPPFGPRSFARWLRWAWLLEGAAQYFSRPAAATRRCSAAPYSTCSRASRGSGRASRSPAGRTTTARGARSRARSRAVHCATRRRRGARTSRGSASRARGHGGDRIGLRAALPLDERRRADEPHDRGLPVARGRDGDARGGARAARPRALRVGVQRVHAGECRRLRSGGPGRRPRRTRAPVPRRRRRVRGG